MRTAEGKEIVWCLRVYDFMDKKAKKFYYDSVSELMDVIREWQVKKCYDTSISFTVSTFEKTERETNKQEIF